MTTTTTTDNNFGIAPAQIKNSPSCDFRDSDHDTHSPGQSRKSHRANMAFPPKEPTDKFQDRGQVQKNGRFDKLPGAQTK